MYGIAEAVLDQEKGNFFHGAPISAGDMTPNCS